MSEPSFDTTTTAFDLSKHYGIEDPIWFCKFCPICTLYQVLDTVMKKEGLKMVVAGVAPEAPGGAPPAQGDMER